MLPGVGKCPRPPDVLEAAGTFSFHPNYLQEPREGNLSSPKSFLRKRPEEGNAI